MRSRHRRGQAENGGSRGAGFPPGAPRRWRPAAGLPTRNSGEPYVATPYYFLYFGPPSSLGRMDRPSTAPNFRAKRLSPSDRPKPRCAVLARPLIQCDLGEAGSLKKRGAYGIPRPSPRASLAMRPGHHAATPPQYKNHVTSPNKAVPNSALARFFSCCRPLLPQVVPALVRTRLSQPFSPKKGAHWYSHPGEVPTP